MRFSIDHKKKVAFAWSPNCGSEHIKGYFFRSQSVTKACRADKEIDLIKNLMEKALFKRLNHQRRSRTINKNFRIFYSPRAEREWRQRIRSRQNRGTVSYLLKILLLKIARIVFRKTIAKLKYHEFNNAGTFLDDPKRSRRFKIVFIETIRKRLTSNYKLRRYYRSAAPVHAFLYLMKLPFIYSVRFLSFNTLAKPREPEDDRTIEKPNPKYELYTKILFIGDPYKRLVTGFLDEYVKHNRPLKIDDLNFEKFVDELEQNRFKNINYRLLVPQLSEAYDPAIEFDKIYDIENVDYRFIDGLFGKSNASTKSYKYEKVAQMAVKDVSGDKVYKLNTGELKKMAKKGKRPPYHSFYNKDIRDKVRKFYARDFAFFEKHGFKYEIEPQ